MFEIFNVFKLCAYIQSIHQICHMGHHFYHLTPCFHENQAVEQYCSPLQGEMLASSWPASNLWGRRPQFYQPGDAVGSFTLLFSQSQGTASPLHMIKFVGVSLPLAACFSCSDVVGLSIYHWDMLNVVLRFCPLHFGVFKVLNFNLSSLWTFTLPV